MSDKSDNSDNEYDSDTNSEIEEGEPKEEIIEDVDIDPDADEEDSSDVDADADDMEDMDIEEEDAGEMMDEDEDEDEDTDSDEEDNHIEDGNYLQKFAKDIHKKIIQDFHPELAVHNYEEILALCEISRDESGVIVDPLHQTVPYVTRYEKARIIGERACQLNSGATPFIEVEKDVIDGETIAIQEFEQKRIPFIVQRPLSNGGCEYWRLHDLEIL